MIITVKYFGGKIDIEDLTLSDSVESLHMQILSMFLNFIILLSSLLSHYTYCCIIFYIKLLSINYINNVVVKLGSNSTGKEYDILFAGKIIKTGTLVENGLRSHCTVQLIGIFKNFK